MSTDTLDLSAFGIASPEDLPAFARITGAGQSLRTAGACAHPIRLTGGRDVIEAATGLLLDTTDHRAITVACGNRRASKCEYCSTLYKYDAYNLVVAGLRGGKDTPPAVAAHPMVFLTLTAPSFGPVHLGPDKYGTARPCHPRRDGTGCPRWHRASDALIGTPLDPTTYDYTGHALFNALAPALWSITTTEIRREIARLAGLTRTEAGRQVKASFAKVAEYQARGIVHFHAVIRLDGPDGPSSPPPAWAGLELLETAIRRGAARARVTAPESRALGEPDFRWGVQLKADPITPAHLDATDQHAEVTDVKVARYVAKYATKSTEAAGLELPRIACRTCDGAGSVLTTRTSEYVPCLDCAGRGCALNLDRWHLTDHARRVIEACWLLGAIPELEPLRLRQWAHMLGFRGHFATKSRAYSTTFGALRQERADYTARLDPETAALLDSPDVLIVNHWAYAGRVDTPPSPDTRSRTGGKADSP